MNDLSVRALFDIDRRSPLEFMLGYKFVWEVLDDLGNFIVSAGKHLGDEYYSPRENVWIHRSAAVAPSAEIIAPCIIEHGATLRHCAYIRGNAYIGDGAVVGNSCEIKNSVLMRGACLPHFNYAGDSVIGRGAHLGAGAVISNLKLDKSNVTVTFGDEKIETGRRKFGAAIGDGAEIGCGAVICPGSVIGKESLIYPLSCVRGYIGERKIYKSNGCIDERRI